MFGKEGEEDGLRVIDLGGERGIGAAEEREDRRRALFLRSWEFGGVTEQEARKGYLEEERRGACSARVCGHHCGQLDGIGTEFDLC